MSTEQETIARRRDALVARLETRLEPEARGWLEERRAAVARDARALSGAFAAAGRKVGRGDLLASRAASAERLEASGPILDVWSVADAARVVLLLEQALRDPSAIHRVAEELYAHGELSERVAVVRSLALLPDGEAGLPILRDALRTNTLDLFAAAICENPAASRILPDDLFFQAVLKCAFVGLAVGRVERIDERTTPELARMLYAFVTEREHAGRPVPPDLWPLIALHPPAGAMERMRARLAETRDGKERAKLELALERAAR